MSSRAGWLTPGRAVVLVALAYLVLQAVLFSVHRAPSWDEAVYLSQVGPHGPAVYFAPSRSRGIVLLAAPVAAFGSTVGVRVFLEVASAAALAGAYAVWVPVVGWAAPVAAVIAGGSWLGLFYGSEVMPNLWAGLLGVAALGWWVRSLDGRRAELWFGAACLAGMALFRPLDAVVMGVVLAGWSFVRRTGVLREVALVAGGLAVGIVPWLVEMSIRFGGPAGALDRASTTGHVGVISVGASVIRHLNLTDGPALGSAASGPISWLGVCWWGGLVALASLALVRSRGRPRIAAAIATIGGGALALEYFVLVNGAAPRFLLPAYALLAIPAGVGLSSAADSVRPRVARVAAASLLVVWVAAQVVVADRIERQAVTDRAADRRIGLELGALAGDRACSFASSEAYPQLQLASGCFGHPVRLPTVSAPRIGAGAEFLVVPATSGVPDAWRRVQAVTGSGGRRLTIYASAGDR